MTTILLATDFSEHAEVAGRIALTLARRLEAKVVCMHASVMTEARPDAYEIARGQLEEFRMGFQEDLARRRHRLQLMVEELERRGVKAEHRLVDGPAVHAICNTARDVGAALVVMGSHGRTGFKRVLLGSVAERVVRLCETSVLVARPPVVGDEGFRRILVPTDFDQAANVALDQSTTLAAVDANIDILHCWQVDEFPDEMLEQTAGASGLYGRVAEAVTETSKRFGEGLVKRVAHGQRRVAFHLIEGQPTAGIHEFIEERDQPYDLIAVGTHGRSGLDRLLIGSVAEVTVRYAPCSVLVARPREE